MTAQTVDTSKLWDMIKDIRFGMLTVRGADGRLYARPMTTQNGEADRGGVIWFFMSRSGQPVADLTAAPDVNVAYADPDSDKYVSVSGAARIVEDPVKKQELWSAAAKAWFPGGVDDPDLALVADPRRRGGILGREGQQGRPDLQARQGGADGRGAGQPGGASPRPHALTRRHARPR